MSDSDLTEQEDFSKYPPPAAALNEDSWKILWTLAWPAVALNLLQTINSLLDNYFVQTLPKGALTALGGSTNVIFLFVSFSMMMGTASTALVSRFYGAKEHENCQIAARKSLTLGLLLGIGMVFLAVPGAFLAAKAFVPSDDHQAQAFMTQYLAVFAMSLPAVNIIQSLAGSLRGVGDTKSPMVISGAQILLHIILNWFLIFPGHDVFGIHVPGAGWGIAGAAAAMTIACWIAAIVYIIYARSTPLHMKKWFSMPDLEWSKRILNIALPSGMLSILRVTSLMAFTFILTHVARGSDAIAALRPGFSLESIAFMPAFGLSIAAATLVGQSLGMKDPERAERLAWTAGHHAAAVSLLASIFLFFFSHQIANLVVPDQPAVAEIAAQYLIYISVTEVFFGYAMVMVGAMQGAGDTLRPMYLTLICMWLIRVPLAAFCVFFLKTGPEGCWFALSATQLIQGLLSMWMFKKGAWKTVRV